LEAGRRSARREAMPITAADSAQLLAGRLAASGSSPSEHVARLERRPRLHAPPGKLGGPQPEGLRLPDPPPPSAPQAAAVLDITEGAVKLRHLRALERLRELLGDSFDEERP